ncbi:prothrombin-like [Uranotaenia lowii]|uniref:prothrombin-like n=1 Tax=Uranotaenia lowii TaxID=190385 RepID=UPI0024791583|nr:prothrombin-like [Uranotaenia lowii]
MKNLLKIFLPFIFIFGTKATGCGQTQIYPWKFPNSGNSPALGSWPWHGALFRRDPQLDTYVCGVTILSKRFVLTIAYCLTDPITQKQIPENRLFVRVGITLVDPPEGHYQSHDVKAMFIHEAFNWDQVEDDIALLRLATKITYSDYVQPICMWQGNSSVEQIVNRTGFIVGWGGKEDNGMAKNLIEAPMTIISEQICIGVDPVQFLWLYHEDKTFCATNANETKPQRIDRGSGLYLEVEDRWTLRGIASRAQYSLSSGGYYRMFTDVLYHLEWIRSKGVIVDGKEN